MQIDISGWHDLSSSFEAFRRHSQDIGFVWAKKAVESAESFYNVVNRFTLSYATDASRRGARFDNKRVKNVDPGFHEMPLHSESSFSPNCPDAIWFYCVLAPLDKRESTTICDGKIVWEKLSQNTKNYLISNPISYDLSIDLDRAMTDREWFVNRLGCGAAKIKDERLHFTSRRYAANELFDSNGRPYLAFANHMFALLEEETQINERTICGQGIPLDIIQECKDVCEANTIDVSWSSGDLVYLNNKRFMHGRRAITPGSKRDIVIAQSERAVF